MSDFKADRNIDVTPSAIFLVMEKVLVLSRYLIQPLETSWSWARHRLLTRSTFRRQRLDPGFPTAHGHGRAHGPHGPVRPGSDWVKSLPVSWSEIRASSRRQL